MESKPYDLLLSYVNNLTHSQRLKFFIAESNFLARIFNIYVDSDNDRLNELLILIVRNCCLDHKLHQILLADEDLLVKLVKPLAGGEQIEEMESLPLDLQYLPLNKEREKNPKIRLYLIESIFQFCATSWGREKIRQSNIYYLLREYHRWETDPNAIKALLNLIDVIIKKEEEINVDNLKDLLVPEDLSKKFNEFFDS